MLESYKYDDYFDLEDENYFYKDDYKFYEEDWSDLENGVYIDEFKLKEIEYKKDLQDRAIYYQLILKEQGWEE